MRFKDSFQKNIYYRSQIDYCFWAIQEISGHLGKSEDPLQAMIDKATGFDKDKIKNNIKNVKYLVNTIIKCKKKIGFDTTNDESFLIELRKL